jgi:hypothetical protein
MVGKLHVATRFQVEDCVWLAVTVFTVVIKQLNILNRKSHYIWHNFLYHKSEDPGVFLLPLKVGLLLTYLPQHRFFFLKN